MNLHTDQKLRKECRCQEKTAALHNATNEMDVFILKVVPFFKQILRKIKLCFSKEAFPQYNQ